MRDRRHLFAQALVASCVLFVATGCFAQSGEPAISIDARGCSRTVHVVARNARLDDVLDRLGHALGFQVQFDGGSQTTVDVDLSLYAPALIKRLSATDSVMVLETRDTECFGQRRISKVWVLGKGPAPARAAAAPPPTPLRSERSRSLEEMSRQAKEAYDAYVQTHGEPPPPVPEEIGQPIARGRTP